MTGIINHGYYLLMILLKDPSQETWGSTLSTQEHGGDETQYVLYIYRFYS
jgi:hypothetical protein